MEPHISFLSIMNHHQSSSAGRSGARLDTVPMPARHWLRSTTKRCVPTDSGVYPGQCVRLDAPSEGVRPVECSTATRHRSGAARSKAGRRGPGTSRRFTRPSKQPQRPLRLCLFSNKHHHHFHRALVLLASNLAMPARLLHCSEHSDDQCHSNQLLQFGRSCTAIHSVAWQ